LLAEMLGVNRKSVTLAAQKLHKEGLIDYHREEYKFSTASCELAQSADVYPKA
jgi:Mn-dependent DtxR family transcriptional regulator